jgi:hypothetical protein
MPPHHVTYVIEFLSYYISKGTRYRVTGKPDEDTRHMIIWRN